MLVDARDKRSARLTRGPEGEQARGESLANSRGEWQVVEPDSGKRAFIDGSYMAAPLLPIFDVGSSNGAAGTKLKGLGPRVWNTLVTSLTHVSVRISSCFHTFPVSGWGILLWLAAIRPILRSTKHPGLYDNAYTTTLSYLQTEGLLDKLIAWQLRKISPPFSHTLSNPHFPQLTSLGCSLVPRSHRRCLPCRRSSL